MGVLGRVGANPWVIADFCRRNGISRRAVFGSALRDDFAPTSDVDLLVEFQPEQKGGLFDMARVELELEQLIHDRRVDLKTPGDLSRRFRDRVAVEAEPIFQVVLGGLYHEV
jgi:predicted nucleotidyltransferase